MTYKKLFVLSTLTLTTKLNAMEKEALLRLHAQLSTLSKALPEAAPSTAETKAASATATENLDPDVASLKQQALAILDKEKLTIPDFRVFWDPVNDGGVLYKLIDLYWDAVVADDNNRIRQLHNVLFALYKHPVKDVKFAKEERNPTEKIEDAGFDTEDPDRPISKYLRGVAYEKNLHLQGKLSPLFVQRFPATINRLTKLSQSKFVESLGYKDKVQEELKALTAIVEAAKPKEKQDILTASIDPQTDKLREKAIALISKPTEVSQWALQEAFLALVEEYLNAIADNKAQKIEQIQELLAEIKKKVNPDNVLALINIQPYTFSQATVNKESIQRALAALKKGVATENLGYTRGNKARYITLLKHLSASTYLDKFPGLKDDVQKLLKEFQG